jgi:predicted enzyme related to lactoylglutathione lyase
VEKVVGIGGVFFRSNDPVALRKWYADNLGIAADEWGALFEATGQTIWSPFAADTDYFKTPQPFMINYCVTDLDAMIAQLRANGVAVDENVEDHSYGKFGWATDPDGNRFELWQPK